MNTQINISRKVLGQIDNKGEFTFGLGDYFNIYEGTGTSESLGDAVEYNLKNYLAFKVRLISNDSIEIELLYKTFEPTETLSLKINESKDIDFKEYGVYTLTLKSIQI